MQARKNSTTPKIQEKSGMGEFFFAGIARYAAVARDNANKLLFSVGDVDAAPNTNAVREEFVLNRRDSYV